MVASNGVTCLRMLSRFSGLQRNGQGCEGGVHYLKRWSLYFGLPLHCVSVDGGHEHFALDHHAEAACATCCYGGFQRRSYKTVLMAFVAAIAVMEGMPNWAD